MKMLSAAWQQRSLRERRLLLVLLGILLAVGLWQGAWLPLQQAIADRQQRLQQLRLQWQQLQHLTPQPQGVHDLRQLLNSTAKEYAIGLQSVTEQAGQAQVRVAVADGTNLLNWLEKLESRYAVRVMELGLQASSPADGRVQIVSLIVGRQ
ncbi:type II secretion system protein GspM [Cedecea colo]|uniref:Type II secretion system protein M n=1 Tax=Cedecea colo TaxID=2552946 RepID=A0ABX0VH22_9ENTR|nr:type II secretion system protein GspM [Cedecea colo]NIY46298.1 hypothetical protein [Cedecea colo]